MTQGGGRRTALRRVVLTAVMQPCSSAARARRRQRARPGCARHRCTVLAAVLLSGCASALDATSRRAVVARLAASAVVTSAARPAGRRFRPGAAARLHGLRSDAASAPPGAEGKATRMRWHLADQAVPGRPHAPVPRPSQRRVADCFFFGTTPRGAAARAGMGGGLSLVDGGGVICDQPHRSYSVLAPTPGKACRGWRNPCGADARDSGLTKDPIHPRQVGDHTPRRLPLHTWPRRPRKGAGDRLRPPPRDWDHAAATYLGPL